MKVRNLVVFILFSWIFCPNTSLFSQVNIKNGEWVIDSIKVEDRVGKKMPISRTFLAENHKDTIRKNPVKFNVSADKLVVYYTDNKMNEFNVELVNNIESARDVTGEVIYTIQQINDNTICLKSVTLFYNKPDTDLLSDKDLLVVRQYCYYASLK